MKKGCLIFFVIAIIWGLISDYPKVAMVIGAIIVVLFIVLPFILNLIRRMLNPVDYLNKRLDIRVKKEAKADESITNEENTNCANVAMLNEEVSISKQTNNDGNTSLPLQHPKEEIKTNENKKTMKLHEAIAYAIEREGNEVITRSLLVNYLADLQAYETPAVKRIVETLVKDGYGEKLLNSLKSVGYELQANDIIARMVRNDGYQQDLVQYVVCSVGIALGEKDEKDLQSIVSTIPDTSRTNEDTSNTTEIASKSKNIWGRPINPREPWTRYQFPSIDLLDAYDSDGNPYMNEDELNAQKDRIVEVFKNYGIETADIAVTVGPTMTFYEITLAQGMKMTKFKRVQEDIALCLYMQGLRIIAPILGKGTIGIEMPNGKENIVGMKSILNTDTYKETNMELPCAIGKTMNDDVFMFDLTTTPHILMAGATGQGKSICLDAIITSLLYKKHPNELKLVLIDPKRVEFSVYSNIANHFMAAVEERLDCPILTDAKKVEKTLASLCILMESRYDYLKKAGVHNVKEYNKKYVDGQLSPLDGHEFMPYIVVVIDEFDVLMMSSGKEIEPIIIKLAHLAHTVGIHLVIATQHPTRSIITENIKSNIPTRIAFRTSTANDSKNIIDCSDANQLIGNGDMLYLNGNALIRVQCAFVGTSEMERISGYISNQPGPIEPIFLPEPLTEYDFSYESDHMCLDPLIKDAASVIITAGSASTSLVQRSLCIGYNRTGRIMDQLEQLGIIGSASGSKPREILMTDMQVAHRIINNYNLH